VANRRYPNRWHSEFTMNVTWYTATVPRTNPQTSPLHPPTARQKKASRMPGTQSSFSSHFSSGYLCQSLISSQAVSPASGARIHPMCDHHADSVIGECGSSSWSECLWCSRWCEHHHRAPRWMAVAPRNARTNWNHRLVLYARWAKYRWNPAVRANTRTA
jgi:hypothetical protein